VTVSGEIVQQHTVEVTFDGGWPSARMVCPFDLTKRDRPCYADQTQDDVDDEGEPVLVDPYCNWKAWFEDATFETLDGGKFSVPVVKATWDFDAYTFTLADLTAESGRTGTTE
jgi:hypothetical protein